VQEASRATASAVDQPPLSRRELAELIAEMRGHYSKVFADTGALLRQLEDTWQAMVAVSRREGVSLEKVLGVMTLEAAGLARKGFGAVAAVGEASWSLLDEAVLTSYRDTLKRIEEQGLGRYLARHYRPFVRAALE